MARRRDRDRGLSDETVDGLTFGSMLACNPRVRERREAYEASLKADRETLRALSLETLDHAIRERRLWTIPSAFDRPVEEKVECIARCMQSRERPLWLATLGLS